MKAQSIVFSEDGHSLIVYRMGVFCWSYSMNGSLGGKSFLTRKRAVMAARKAANKKVSSNLVR